MSTFIQTRSGRLVNRDHISECTHVLGEGSGAHRYCWLKGDDETKFEIPFYELPGLIAPETVVTADTTGRFVILEYLAANNYYAEEVFRLPIIAWAHCDGFGSQPVVIGAVPEAFNKWDPDHKSPQWLLDYELKIVHDLPVMDEELANGISFDQWLKKRRDECAENESKGDANGK